MKNFLKIISIILILTFTFPMITFAEGKQNSPVIVETDCTIVKNNAKKILIKELKISESTPNTFSRGKIFTFNVKGMEFQQADIIKPSVDRKNFKMSFSQEGNLDITINAADDLEVETITLSNIELTVKWLLPVGTYYLYMSSSDLDEEKVPVATNFVKVIDNIDCYNKKELEIEVKIDSNAITVNNSQKYLKAPTYISSAGYTMLPIREFAELFPSTKFFWNNENKEASILYGEKYVSIVSETGIMMINGKTYSLQNIAEVQNGRMFLSLRDICQIYGIPNEDIFWDKNTRTVIINTEVY